MPYQPEQERLLKMGTRALILITAVIGALAGTLTLKVGSAVRRRGDVSSRRERQRPCEWPLSRASTLQRQDFVRQLSA